MAGKEEKSKSKEEKGKEQKGTVKHSKEDKLEFRKEDLRWATNEAVADWRAERLKCERIADVGCGIGLQAFSFAKKCRHVLGIDVNTEKIEIARKNASKLRFRNIEFTAGNALDPEIIEKIKEDDAEIVFLDPERDASAEKRKIEAMKPDINKFLARYGKITSRIAVEFPPQIKEMPFDCEQEYASVNGKLNRLTLYFGPLKNAERSAVILPSGKTISNDRKARLVKARGPKKYVYEVDGAVHKAGLLAELCAITGTELASEKKYAFMTSEEKMTSPFFKAMFRVLSVCGNDPLLIKTELRKCKAASVVIRLEVDPKEYWQVRNEYEQGLSGNREVVLLGFENVAVICEKMQGE
ncbi:class I SAM-dependent methyltransferase [Candidatus Woesearchaeota archaeon]|nr:class I SAM-dependent methyltransferase [Candidatus Woesearchaeota archaeon]